MSAPVALQSQDYPFRLHVSTTIPCACGRQVTIESTETPAWCVCGRAYRLRLWVDELRPAPVPAPGGGA